MSRLAQAPTTRLARTVRELLETRALDHADRVAIGAPGRPPLTYGQLLTLVRSTADALARLGCVRGDRIAVVMSHGSELATVSLALMASATCVPLNPDYTEPELRALLKRLRVSMLVTTPEQVGAGRAARAEGVVVVEVERDVCGPAGAFALSSAGAKTLRTASDPETLAHADPNDVALVLHTSGSTAAPKVVPLTHRNLRASAANVARSLALGPRDTCLSCLPLFHIGGLLDLLLAPLHSGGGVVIATGMSGADFFAHLERTRPTWYQGVPTMLLDIVRGARRARSEGRRLPRQALRLVRSVSAPLPAETLRAFEGELGVPVIEMYGMTETAGVITSNPLPPGERRAGSVGIPAGPQIAIVDDARNRVAPGARGEVLVRGESVTAGYEQPDGSVEALVDGWLHTGDEGYLDADGYLFLTGRIKEIINRGGEKISPREIDEVALAYPGVADAAAFALPHETLGEDVALAVVARAGRVIDVDELSAHCAARLARYKVPRRVFLLESLPRTRGGKLQRVRLAEICPAHGAPVGSVRDGAAAPVPSERQALLLECWKEILEVEEVGAREDFFDAGGDSLRAVELALRVSDRLGWELPVSAIYDHPTVDALDAALDALVSTVNASPGVPWPAPRTEEERRMLSEVRDLTATWTGSRPHAESLLVGRNTLGSRPALFWGAQGDGEFRDFADRLGADQPVYGMRSLYETASKSPENSRALARHYRTEIERLQPSGPILLGGYCAGAGVALEIARGLREAGREVATLCLFEHFSPEPYGGRVAFFFAAESGWHPFRTLGRPWAPHYSGPVRLFPSRAGHEDILRDPDVVAEVRRELVEASSEGPELGDAAVERAGGAATPAPLGGSGPLPRVLNSRATRRVRLPVRNEGDSPWPAGTLVYASWGRPASERIFFTGFARLDEPLAPGERVQVPLDVRAPVAPGPWTLAAHVVPGGDWNGGGDASALRRTVHVLPGAPVWAYLRGLLAPTGLWLGSSGGDA